MQTHRPLCNLACEYCFYLEKTGLFPETHGAEFRMRDDLLEEFTRQYLACQHPGAGEVNFAWQGGEPTLMGIDFFRRAVELQKQYKGSEQKVTMPSRPTGFCWTMNGRHS